MSENYYQKKHPNAGMGRARVLAKAWYPKEYAELEWARKKQQQQNARCHKTLKAQRILGGACIQCRETDPKVLEFHHKDGNGKLHREQIGRLNPDAWIVSHPEEAQEQFELLCANCHKRITYHPKQKTIDAHNLFGGICAVCGIEDPYVLEFSHINDNGKEHRKLVGNIADWALRVGYEAASEVVENLCANCHARKHSKFNKCST